MTNKLTPFEQMVYDWFQQGYTAGGIAVKFKIKYADIVDARYQILKKGYELEKNCIPNSEKEETFEIGGATMEHKDNKHKHLTEEEKHAVIEYRKNHTYKQTQEKFGISAVTIANLEKKAKAAEAQHPEPAQNAETATQTDAPPTLVLDAVRMKIADLDQKIETAKAMIASAKKDRDTLAAWMEGTS